MYNASNNAVGFVTGGVERVRIDHLGNGLAFLVIVEKPCSYIHLQLLEMLELCV